MKRQNAIAAPLRDFVPEHFRLAIDNGIAVITLDRPDRKNPLTFESYAELRDTFRAMRFDEDVTAIVVTGSGGNFSSGGAVFEIIEPLTKMEAAELHAFTTMTGDLVKEMRACPQPVIAAVEGICAGAGAIMAMVSDMRIAGSGAKVNSVTKRMLQMEWAMGVDEAIDAEAIAQALCMKTGDFRRAFEAFAAKRKPVFEGN